MAALLLGPGICVLTMGARGSSGKKACSPPLSEETAAAAAEAYCLRSAAGAIVDTVGRTIDDRARPAVRRR